MGSDWIYEDGCCFGSDIVLEVIPPSDGVFNGIHDLALNRIDRSNTHKE